MLNNAVIVGRIVSAPIINETENGKKESLITLAVPSTFKNNEGEYETNFIPCLLQGGIAENTANYCRSGDLVGIKGRLSRTETEQPMTLVAEKVTFLASKKTEE